MLTKADNKYSHTKAMQGQKNTQTSYKIATKANMSAYPRKKMIKYNDKGTLQCKIN